MAAPTFRQRQFFDDLVNKPGLVDSLNDNERVIVKRAQRPEASYAQVSSALDVLRSRRTQVRRAQGVEPTPTPVNTYPQRVKAVTLAMDEWRRKTTIAESLAEVVERPMPEGACLDCGHNHEGRMVCTGSVSVTDPRYGSLTPQQQSTFNALGGGAPLSHAQCGCNFYTPPEPEAVLAWEAVLAADLAKDEVTKCWQAARTWLPGDVLVVERGKKYPIGLRGIFLRQHENPEYGIAYLLRVTGLRVVEENGKKTYHADDSVTSEVDVWVAQKNVERVDDHLVPDTDPTEPVLQYTAA